jgi:amino acid adenylation domain-containing protein
VSTFLVDGLLTEARNRWPTRPAVRAGDRTLTYEQLDVGANRVASALGGVGVARGDRVGLYLEKGLEAITAVYGIMRAGAAYVPLDPMAPPARCAFIAKNCGIAALVADSDRAENLLGADRSAVDRGIVCGTEAPAGFETWDAIQSGPSDPPRRRAIDTDLAYILYTSGSTGQPKGVMISHRNALTFVEWAAAEFQLGPDDILSNHAPFHFDLSTFDFFGAARAGAVCTIVPRATAMFPQELARWIGSEGITVWYSAPSALSLLVRYGSLSEDALASLRLILFAGEVFPNKYLAELMLRSPNSRFFNLFGPTETNVCTFYEVKEPPAATDPTIPIGRACANTVCSVLDESGREVTESNVEGELVVRGSIVAQGYWGGQALGAERFVERNTYRTGDIVYWSEPGDDPVLRFVGRQDHMVKTRGYRVELGEIEYVLNSHDGVEEAAAIAVPDELLGSRIVAFCVVRGGGDIEKLRAFCRDSLPLYMVPAELHLRTALPRNSNGKIDRVSLASELEGTELDRAPDPGAPEI